MASSNTMSYQMTIIFLYLLQALGLGASTALPRCKSVPGSAGWPSNTDWSTFNRSLSGHLIQPSPPGAVCHLTQSTFDAAACSVVQAGWKTSVWHTENPVSSIEDNWNNNTCLPDATALCSGAGYPLYVVNATCATHVKKAVDFARKNNIRLIVKGTGHDYLGRSSAPNSLSIWTHHMRGVSFHNGFKPKGCSSSIDGYAITAAAGTQMRELDEKAHLRNLTIVSGGAETVGVGGYLTGGGHGALSPTFGMAADQVLEMDIVTSGGDILTINECQNNDLFWAMRGGGGSTFGVITSVTIQAHPSFPFLTSSVYLGTSAGDLDIYTVVAKILAQFPTLDAAGISAYTFLSRNITAPVMNITFPIDAFYGIFNLPVFSSANTSQSLSNTVDLMLKKALDGYPPGKFLSSVDPPVKYDDFWAWWKDNNGPLTAGGNVVLGSRLLGQMELSADTATLAKAIKEASYPNGMDFYLVGPGGQSSRKVVPRGGGSVANSVWKNALVHTVLSATWPAFDTVQQAAKTNAMTHTYVQALRNFAPGSHAYVNEADPNELDFQHVFWGENYKSLAKIKKKYDPTDTLWCHPCVGNEGWEVVDDVLCRVQHGSRAL